MPNLDTEKTRKNKEKEKGSKVIRGFWDCTYDIF